jgi:hypothetical protein
VTLFISYSSADADVVGALERNLESFGKKVWRDNEVTGGQAWWAAILEQIRACDVFIFALSPNSLESDPCALEFGYAKALGLPILPVEIGEVPAESRRNYAVYNEQIVDYRTYTPDAAIALMRAVSEREGARKPLPDPLPPEPPTPYEYLLRLSSVIRMREPISYEEQRRLIGEFRDALGRERNESVRKSIRGLLGELKERPETSHSVETEIEELLARFAAPGAARQPVAPIVQAGVAEPINSAGPPAGPGVPAAVLPPPPGSVTYAHEGYPTIPQAPAAPAPHLPQNGGYPPSNGGYGVAPGPPPPNGGYSFPPGPPPPTGGYGVPPGPPMPTGGYGVPPGPPPPTGGGRRLAIILGSIAAAVVVLGLVIFLLVPKGPVEADPGTPPSEPVGCWDGSEAATTDECAEFTGASALEYAFVPGEGPNGAEPLCTEEDPSDDDVAAGAVASLFCTWEDLPGTSLQLLEWDMEPADVQEHWSDSFTWDSDYTWTLSDEPIGKGWDLSTTLDSGEVWLWAGAFDDLPLSFEILSSAGDGGSEAAAQTVWDGMSPVDPEEIAALPGIVD